MEELEASLPHQLPALFIALLKQFLIGQLPWDGTQQNSQDYQGKSLVIFQNNSSLNFDPKLKGVLQVSVLKSITSARTCELV